MQESCLQSFNKFGHVVKEEMLFKEIVDARTDARWTTENGPSQKFT
jgi:hypothetical protein